MRVLVTSPQKIIYEGYAKRVVLPASEGQMCVLDFHQACLCSLKDGWIEIYKQWGRTQKQRDESFLDVKKIMIKQGMARLANNELVLMIEAS